MEYGSKLSQAQLLAGLGNSFSVPVFSAIAENILKCFNGQKVDSDSEDSDSDGLWSEAEWCNNDEGSVVRPPAKKRRISTTVNSTVHRAITEKHQNYRLMRAQVKYKAKPTTI